MITPMSYPLCELPPRYAENRVLKLNSKLLRFDPTGAIHPDYGVTADQLNDLYPRLSELRRELIETPEPSFYKLPQAQLDAYKQRREASELGRIFKVANSQMDVVDAVVVLASGSGYLAARSIMDACCDPYHNELRRGPRGGKPRMYFAGNRFDNDTTQALLSRITAGGYGDSDTEQNWTLVVIDDSGESGETAASCFHFLQSLKANLKADHAQRLATRFVPIVGSSGRLRELAVTTGCANIFDLPAGVHERFTVFSAVGLLPAAMLGLDINKLLEGAVAMNEHFESTPPEKNMVLQFVAIHRGLRQHRGNAIGMLHVWTQALETVGRWYQQLNPDSGVQLGIKSIRRDRATVNLILQHFRTDALLVHGSGQVGDMADLDFASIMSSVIEATNDRLHSHDSPTADLILPVLDTFILGQLLQMLMIATALEVQLNVIA